MALAIIAIGGLGTSGVERGPLVILSDADFTAENGVVAGSGTPDDPYIIAGWQIQVADEAFGVHIEGTSGHFILRGVMVSGAQDPEGAAIYLAQVRNGTVEDCVVQDSVNGIKLAASSGITLRENFLAVAGVGLEVTGTEASEYHHSIERTNRVNGKDVLYYYNLSDQTLEGIVAGHITLANCRDVTLRGPKVEDADGITVAFSQGIRIEGADLFRNRGNGLFVLSSPGTVVTDCERIANNAQAGISVWLSEWVRVERSGLYANQVGLFVNASDRLISRDNAHGGNAIGALVTGGSREVEIRECFFYRDRNGVVLDVAIGPLLFGNAFTDTDVAVLVEAHATYPVVRDCTMVNVGYGISVIGSQGTFERNLISRAQIGIIFEETYGRAKAEGNTVRQNVIYRSLDGLYLGRQTTDTWIYENLFWECERPARDLGQNRWAPSGRGNWYSDYRGPDALGDGIGDAPLVFSDGQDPAPLMGRDFLPDLPGVVGTMRETTVTLVDAAGTTTECVARVADQAHERFIGFQGLPPELAQDLAIIFFWEEPVTSTFHMRNVFLPLEAAFFAEDGAFLGVQRMEADSSDLYGVASPFWAVLELPAGWLSQAALTPPLRLINQYNQTNTYLGPFGVAN